MSRLSHSDQATMDRLDTMRAIDEHQEDIVWENLTWMQQRILKALQNGPSKIGRKAKSLIPLESLGLITRFRRDYLMRKYTPTLWKLTDHGERLVSTITNNSTKGDIL